MLVSALAAGALAAACSASGTTGTVARSTTPGPTASGTSPSASPSASASTTPSALLPTASPVTALATTIAVAGSPSGPASPAPPSSTPAGTDPFAGRRIVAYYGTAGTSSLGVLGEGTPAQSWGRLNAQALPYDAPGRPAVRCFELIATVASDEPGSDGLYRNRLDASAIAPYLATVRAHGGVLLLDIQPGRSDFLDEAKALAPLLELPDVGLALDPEWRMSPGQVPGQVIGSVGAAEVNSVSSWLEGLTVARHLPDKLFVVHEFTEPELEDETDLQNEPHLHEIVNVDGFGPVAVKLSVYHRLARLSPYATGLKLFYRQDPVLMPPRAVLAIRPVPQLVDYE